MDSIIPIKRKILVEKITKEDLEIQENKFILEVTDNEFNITDSFIVLVEYIPTAVLNIEEFGHFNNEFIFDKRVSWEPIDVFFIENLGNKETKKFINWFTCKSSSAINISLTRTFKNETKSREKWLLYGCKNDGVFDFYETNENKCIKGICVAIDFNHCTLSWSD